MSDPAPAPQASAHCVCDGVSYEVRGELRDVIDCHCWRCRRWSGHHMAATSAAVDDIVFVTDRTLRWFDCGDGAEYGFCGRCGASVGWRHRDRPETMSLCAGLIDPPTGLSTTMAIYAADAGDYHRLDPDVPAWPGEHD